MYEVRITEPAESDIQAAFSWWKDNRSAEQAARWLDSIYHAIATLGRMPDRCSRAQESYLGKGNYRQLLFGVGRRLTHRVVFATEGETVFVPRARHVAQADLGSDDLVQ